MVTRNLVSRDRVLEAIQRGKLPRRAPDRTWGGRGSGGFCAICDERIGVDEMELELEFGLSLGERSKEHRVHLKCFSAWESECRKLELGPRSSGELPDQKGVARFAADGRESPDSQGGP